MEKRLATFIACLFLSLGMALAQIQVSGVVTSAEDGMPVVGASIKVVGTHTGTVTDIEGNFALTVQAGAKLEISYIGMISKTVKATKNMKIILEPDNHALEEVLVVAFGTAKKSAFTGSAAVVGSEELSKKIATNVTDALVGSVPGLQLRGASGQPGSSNSGINIRGIASMYAATDPLVIVDGAPYPGNLSSIPTDDIESVTVLKTGLSTATYGHKVGGLPVKFRPKNGACDQPLAVAAAVDVPLMRVEEMKLIEIEAVGRQNEAKGIEMLTAFAKKRDPQYQYGTHNEAYGNTKTSAFVNEVWWQRRVEFWGEGLATFDIKRLEKGIIRSYANTNHFDGFQWNTTETPKWMTLCIIGTEADINKALVNNPIPEAPNGNSPQFAW